MLLCVRLLLIRARSLLSVLVRASTRSCSLAYSRFLSLALRPTMIQSKMLVCLALATLAAAATTLEGWHLREVEHHPRAHGSGSHCNPYFMAFNASTPASKFEKDFDPLSPPSSYSKDPDGLKLFLDKPDGTITRKGRTNSKVAEGATFNSTFTVRCVLRSRSWSIST